MILSCCAAVAVADPSVASEADAAPTASYIEHAASGLTAENLGLNDLADPSAPLASRDRRSPSRPMRWRPLFPSARPISRRPSATSAARSPIWSAIMPAPTRRTSETNASPAPSITNRKGEPLAGQLAVAEVIINRVALGRFPSSICGVVRQRGQFSFVRGGRIPQPPQAARNWRTAVAIAQIAMADLADSPAPSALFFHARRVNPGWRLTPRRDGRQPHLLSLSLARRRPPRFPAFPFHSSLGAMATLPDSRLDGCFADLPLVARDVARGVTRMFFRQDLFALCEVPLPNGRRADMMALERQGRAHHRRDQGVARRSARRPQMDRLSRLLRPLLLGGAERASTCSPFEGGCRSDECAGLIVADRYDAAVMREAPCRPLAAARRKAETLRFARRAARRLAGDLDPGLAGLD